MNENVNGKHLDTGSKICTILWSDGLVEILDQRLLPKQETYVRYQYLAEVSDAIRDMVVRGAPAIGIAATYGAVLTAREAYTEDSENWRSAIEPLLQLLSQSRPTAVSLSFAIKRMCGLFDQISGDPEPLLLNEARYIHKENILVNRRMGELSAYIIGEVEAILTHCNAGSLAAGSYGTDLGVIQSVFGRHNLEKIYSCEIRPWMQGAHLTVWGLNKDGIPVTLSAQSCRKETSVG